MFLGSDSYIEQVLLFPRPVDRLSGGVFVHGCTLRSVTGDFLRGVTWPATFLNSHCGAQIETLSPRRCHASFRPVAIANVGELL